MLRRLQEQYQYDAVQTCAGDGTCALPCPIEIDTGDLMREFRHASQTDTSEGVARFVAQRWDGVERAGKIALRGARYMGDTLGWKAVRAVADTARRSRAAMWFRPCPIRCRSRHARCRSPGGNMPMPSTSRHA